MTSASLGSDHSKTHQSTAESPEENGAENLSDVTDAVQKADELSIQNSSEDRPAPSLPLALADDSTVNSFRMLSTSSKHLIRFGLLEEDNHSCNALTEPIIRATQDVLATSCKSSERLQSSGVPVHPVVITDRPFAAVSANNALSVDGLEEMTAYSWTNASDPSESSDVEDERTINEDEIIYVSARFFRITLQ